jgi:hypothetical protein
MTMPLKEATLRANALYWQEVAERYRIERDKALRESAEMQRILLEQTGRAWDGNDYLREVMESKAESLRWKDRVYNFLRRVIK